MATVERWTRDQLERAIGETGIAGVAAQAAFSVLVDGWTQKAAAAAFGVDQAAVSRVVSRVREVRARMVELVRERLLWCSGALKDFPELCLHSGDCAAGTSVDVRGELSACVSDALAVLERCGGVR